MDEEYMILAEAEDLYPGRVVRSGTVVDWASVLQASVARERRDKSRRTRRPRSLSSETSQDNTPGTTPHQSTTTLSPVEKSKSLSSETTKTTTLSSQSKTLSDQAQPSRDSSPSRKATNPTSPTFASPLNSSKSNMTSSPIMSSSATLTIPPENISSSKSQRTRTSKRTAQASVSEKLRSLLAEPTVNVDALKNLSWAGLPGALRAPIWKILLGYSPANTARRHDTLARKRAEYREAVEQHYTTAAAVVDNDLKSESLSAVSSLAIAANQEDPTMRQIAVDIPRTCPGQPLFQIPEVQLALQRVLYVWATRHPASGYVQGMNDLVTPFMAVFLGEYVQLDEQDIDIPAGEGASAALRAKDMSAFENAENALANAEADSYWCLTALLNDIQDYYTFSQPGIQRRVHFLRELVSRVDSGLCSHLEEQGLDFLQFAFRWMNCLLMRELPFPLIVRVWDTYLAEDDGFAVFHVYVCAALLVSFSDDLVVMDFQDLVMFLQNLPTQNWSEKNIDIILSQAYMWRTIFGAAPSHLQ